jgi:hypothetical protein
MLATERNLSQGRETDELSAVNWRLKYADGRITIREGVNLWDVLEAEPPAEAQFADKNSITGWTAVGALTIGRAVGISRGYHGQYLNDFVVWFHGPEGLAHV